MKAEDIALIIVLFIATFIMMFVGFNLSKEVESSEPFSLNRRHYQCREVKKVVKYE